MHPGGLPLLPSLVRVRVRLTELFQVPEVLQTACSRDRVLAEHRNLLLLRPNRHPLHAKLHRRPVHHLTTQQGQRQRETNKVPTARYGGSDYKGRHSGGKTHTIDN